ncbi:hypothetical protein LXL04_011696 [Taraxacum kok-saghyz]
MGPIVLTQIATGLSVLAGAALLKSVLDQNPMMGPGSGSGPRFVAALVPVRLSLFGSPFVLQINPINPVAYVFIFQYLNLVAEFMLKYRNAKLMNTHGTCLTCRIIYLTFLRLGGVEVLKPRQTPSPNLMNASPTTPSSLAVAKGVRFAENSARSLNTMLTTFNAYGTSL